MSDERTPDPTAPRRPEPDPFCLAVARELGLDPHQVIDGTMRLEWQGSASLPEEARPIVCDSATVESATVEGATTGR